jgi:hypothetical protein
MDNTGPAEEGTGRKVVGAYKRAGPAPVAGIRRVAAAGPTVVGKWAVVAPYSHHEGLEGAEAVVGQEEAALHRVAGVVALLCHVVSAGVGVVACCRVVVVCFVRPYYVLLLSAI